MSLHPSVHAENSGKPPFQGHCTNELPPTTPASKIRAVTESGFVSKTSRLADLNLEVIATHGPTETRTTPTKPAVPAAKLRVIRGLRLSAEFQLYEGSNLIGRRDDRPVDVDVSDLEPPDRIWASRHHAMITVNNGLMI